MRGLSDVCCDLHASMLSLEVPVASWELVAAAGATGGSFKRAMRQRCCCQICAGCGSIVAVTAAEVGDAVFRHKSVVHISIVDYC